MFFKNLYLFRLTAALGYNAESLNDKLQAARFAPCTSVQAISFGFVPPVGKAEDAPLVHAANGVLMLCLQIEEKVLPGAVIQEALLKRLTEYEERAGKMMGKKQRDEARDEIILDLLPRAFSQHRRQYAYIDPTTQVLVIDTASPTKAEFFASALRRAIESLPVTLLQTQESPVVCMSRWLSDNPPTSLVIENSCLLKGDDKASITLREVDLSTDELNVHLEAGKQPSQMKLTWRDRLSFAIDAELRIKRLRFLEIVQEKRADIETDSEASRFDADFVIMAGEVAEFVPEMLAWFGGLAKVEK